MQIAASLGQLLERMAGVTKQASGFGSLTPMFALVVDRLGEVRKPGLKGWVFAFSDQQSWSPDFPGKGDPPFKAEDEENQHETMKAVCGIQLLAF